MHNNIVQFFPRQTAIEKFKDKLLVLLNKERRSEWNDVCFELIEIASDLEFPFEIYADTLSLLEKLDRLDMEHISKLPTRIVYLIKFLIDAIDLFIEPATAENFISLADMGADFEYSERYDENTLIEVVNMIKSSDLASHVRIWMGLVMAQTTSRVKLYAIENCLLDGEDRLYFYKICCFYSMGDDNVISAAIDGIIAMQDKYDASQINSTYLEILEFLPYASKCYGKIAKRIRFNNASAYYNFFKDLIQDKCTSESVKQAIKERLEVDERNLTNERKSYHGESDEMCFVIRRLSFLLMNYMR